MCDTPITITIKRTDEKQAVPCGKCPKCLSRRISGWSFRLMQEDKYSTSSHFVTLTYDTANVPISRNGFMSLEKRDLQLFFKRLRKSNVHRLKYYAVGEYGSDKMRPHYHILLFNVSIDTIEIAWGNGSVHHGCVSAASVGYTLKYMCKPSKVPRHRNDDRVPEFSLMSKNLGLDTSPLKCAVGTIRTISTVCT